MCMVLSGQGVNVYMGFHIWTTRLMFDSSRSVYFLPLLNEAHKIFIFLYIHYTLRDLNIFFYVFFIQYDHDNSFP